MVTRLAPDIVNRFWGVIKFAIAKSVPPLANGADEAGMTSILMKILNDEMQAWLVQDDRNEPVAIMLTMITREIGINRADLLIYSIYGMKPLNMKMLNDIIKQLEMFGKATGCSNIIYQSDRENVIEITKRLGFSTDTVLGIKEIQ